MSVSDATSSAAFIAAAIKDREDDGREQVSDVVDDTTNNNIDNVSNDDVKNDKDVETEVDVFFGAAQEIMNQSNKKLGTAAMEDRQFRSFFGTQNEIVLKVWACWGRAACAPRIASPSI
jgi:hypothetical protein